MLELNPQEPVGITQEKETACAKTQREVRTLLKKYLKITEVGSRGLKKEAFLIT